MAKEGDPEKLRIIQMHLVLDEQGKVRVPSDLMEALGIKPGDMLSFYFDKETDAVMVKGEKKPPYFHAEEQLAPRIPQRAPTSASPLLSAPTPEVTQMKLFETASVPPSHPSRRRRTR